MDSAPLREEHLRVDLLKVASQSRGIKVGVTANSGLHTNELIAGVQFAVDDCNIDTELLWMNDRKDKRKAEEVANFFIVQGVDFVIGHLSASASLPASNIYQQNAIPFFAPGTTHDDLTDLSKNYIYRICGTDFDQAIQITDCITAISDTYMPITMIIQDLEYPVSLSRQVTRNLLKKSLTPICMSSIADVPSEVLSMGGVIFISGIHEFVIDCCLELQTLGFSGSVVTGDDCYIDNFAKQLTDVNFDIFVIFPEMAPINNHIKISELQQRYFSIFGEKPGAYFINSYIAMLLIYEYLEQSCSLPKAFNGATIITPLGPIEIKANGDVGSIEWKVLKVLNGAFIEAV